MWEEKESLSRGHTASGTRQVPGATLEARDPVAPPANQQKLLCKAGSHALNSRQKCHFLSLSLISIVHLIKKMREDEKLKIGTRIIFFFLRQDSSPSGCQEVSRGIQEGNEDLAGGRGRRITCTASEPLLITWRGPAALAPTQPHAQTRLLLHLSECQWPKPEAGGKFRWRRLGSHPSICQQHEGTHP